MIRDVAAADSQPTDPAGKPHPQVHQGGQSPGVTRFQVAICAPTELLAAGVAGLLGAQSRLALAVPITIAGSPGPGREPWSAPWGLRAAPAADAVGWRPAPGNVSAILAGDPDVVVVAARSGGDSWLLAVVGALVSQRPGLRVFALVDRVRHSWLPRLADAGVGGIADQGIPASELAVGVASVAAGHDWVAPTVAAVMSEQLAIERAGTGPLALSSRELAVLQVLSLGADNNQIGDELGISAHTVASHVQAICTKLHATSRLHAVSIALRTGLVAL